MKLPSDVLQKAYYEALTGAVQYFTDKVSTDGGTIADSTHVASVRSDLASYYPSMYSPCVAGKSGTLYALTPLTVPVFDVVPPGTDYPYVVLTGQNVIETNFNSDKRITEIICDVDVVTGYEGSFGGKKLMYEISEDVIELIRRTAGDYVSLEGFTMLTATLDSTVSIQQDTETHVMFINRLRFRHKIQEN